MSDQEDEVFLRENSLTRYIVGPCKLNVSSSMVHRIQKFLKCAANHNYLPYSSEKQGKLSIR